MRNQSIVLVCLLCFGCNNNSPKQAVSPPAENKSWSLVPFIKADGANPIMGADSNASFRCPIIGDVKWEAKDVFNPAAVVRNDTVYLLYRAEDRVGKYAGTSRIGLAWSTDGFHFTKYPVPVLYPDNDTWKKYEWEGGCEDPRVVADEHGMYYMTYTAYDGRKARLMVAGSKDLLHWTKYGPAFLNSLPIEGSPAVDTWSKSGSIVSRYVNGQAVATKINGLYWMFWGDTGIFLASSPDLIHWTPVTGNDNRLLAVFTKRDRKFDSDLVEPGPPAMITNNGILLMYNSRNNTISGDTTIPDHTYSASQILLAKDDASKVVDRMDTYFMKPDKPYEITGQVNQVCFIEGLVQLKGKWLLYYGTADSKIAVAEK
jgi:predicted GH43/DUF377 family glycosyl hydrolase